MFQFLNYPDLGYLRGITDYRTKIEMNLLFLECLKDINANNTVGATQNTCQPLFSRLLLGTNKLSPFDTRELYSDTTYFESIRPYVERDDVKAALKLNQSSIYRNCDNTTFSNFLPEFYRKTPDNFISNILKNNYRVLLYPFFINSSYNGQFDLRVDSYGTNEYIRYMNWEGRPVFNSMKQIVFTDSFRNYGQFKSHLGFTHMIVYGAGHIAARTAPKQTLSMINRFIGPTQNLCDQFSPNCVDRAYTCPGNCTSHGTCLSKFSCKCSPGYSESDCSIGRFPLNIKANQKFYGTVFGKDVNIFQYEIIGADSLLDVSILFKRTSNIGTPYIYLSVHGENFLPTTDQFRSLVNQKIIDDSFGVIQDYGFMHVNNSNDPNKEIFAKGLQLIRGTRNFLTLVIYNSDDFVTDYSFDIITDAAYGIIQLSAVMTTCLIFVCIIVVFQAVLILAGCQVVSEYKDQKINQVVKGRESLLQPISQSE